MNPLFSIWPTLGQGFATFSGYNKNASNTKKGSGRYHKQGKIKPREEVSSLSTPDMTGAVV